MTDDGEKKDKLYDPCFYDLKKKKTQPNSTTIHFVECKNVKENIL